jgi:DNA-binding CsgD family transcriptional regulator
VSPVLASPARLTAVRLVASLLSLTPANAPLLLLVVPIALIGRRWGSRWACGAAALAVALAIAGSVTSGGQVGLLGCLTRATVFTTVALLAGACQRQPARRRENVSAVSFTTAPDSRPAEILSARELEVLAIIAEGASNAEIAARLVIADTTAQSHVKNILRKLGVRNRTEAAIRYVAAHGHGGQIQRVGERPNLGLLTRMRDPRRGD